MACSQTAPNRFDWSKHAPAWLVRTYRLSASLGDLFSGLHMLYRLPFQDPDVIGFVRATRKRLAHNAVAVGTCSVQSRVVTVLVEQAWRPPIPPSKCRGTNPQIPKSSGPEPELTVACTDSSFLKGRFAFCRLPADIFRSRLLSGNRHQRRPRNL